MNFRQLPDLIIRNANIVNEGQQQICDVLIQQGRMSKIQPSITGVYNAKSIEADGAWLLPGMIDDQVHFRDPGSPQKGSFASESLAAAIGGITSFMDMPNTNPPTLDLAALHYKKGIAAQHSIVNYA
ncbi:dihydroorotase, partial [Acinetobacter baumannii]|nr:dihydroorotase [Acinetobacter baumannii]